MPDLYSIRHVEERIESLAVKYNKKDIQTTKMEIEETHGQIEDSIEKASMELVRVISRSNSQNLEANIVRQLNEIERNHMEVGETHRVTNILADSIFTYEADDGGGGGSDEDDSHIQENKKSSDYMAIDVLLDLYCRRDPHIVRRRKSLVVDEDMAQFKLLFVERRKKRRKEATTTQDSLTQSFLLALFIHQADWSNLADCVKYLLETRASIFSKFNRRYSLNPTIVLDFFSSLIHIPELWKGTETRILQV